MKFRFFSVWVKLRAVLIDVNETLFAKSLKGLPLVGEWLFDQDTSRRNGENQRNKIAAQTLICALFERI